MVTRLILLSFLFASSSLFAQDAAVNSMEVERPTEQKNKPPGEDVDLIITNSKMRAETGSKSKYSIATSLGYSAGSLAKPLGDDRPNITGATGSTDVTALSGSISGKYAFTTQQSLMAGIGMRWITPFSGSEVPHGYKGDKVDADNPYATYQYLYRWAGVQSALQFMETFFTASNLVRDGYVTTWGLSQNNVYEIGETGISVGVNAYVGVGYFNKNDATVKANQSDYSAGFSPALEYRVNDRFSLHTDSNLFIYQHVRSEHNPHTYQRQAVTQSASLGYAATRDIFVSPGLTWVPGNLQAKSTLVSLSANINVF